MAFQRAKSLGVPPEEAAYRWLEFAAFDRTYEGLKRRLHRHHLGLLSPFDRTYEGLKRIFPGTARHLSPNL